jgi:hypothetical protein
MKNNNFIAERISKIATIVADGNIEKVFPLFGAFEERKWAEDWNPTLVYPSTETIEEGTVFKTGGHGHNETEFLWIVSKYEPEKHFIQYLVTTENRYWTITIKCGQLTADKTTAEITYTYTGLNELGNKINAHAIEKMYSRKLKDWEEEINHYLEKGKTLSHK